MSTPASHRILAAFREIFQKVQRPELLAFLPALPLSAYWLGGEVWLFALTLAVPIPIAFALAARRGGASVVVGHAGLDGLARRGQIISHLDSMLVEPSSGRRGVACFVINLDGEARLVDLHGRNAQTEVLERLTQRLASVLREGDMIARLEGGGFAVGLGAQRRMDIEMAIQLSGRMQSAIAAPFSLDARRIYVTASVGFCIAQRASEPGGKGLLDAAQIAADFAARQGPGSIRAYQPDMARHKADRDATRDELARALEEGQIQAYFQPQISTDTSAITGFESLARWIHPERGPIPPSEFLPLIHELGLSDLLGEVMLRNALRALRAWDEAGHRIGSVAVNFSEAELRDPKLADRLKWELDRFELAPQRLTIEILETVVANTDNDVIARNIAALSAMGCGIDLDDFGTGHSSITSVRRFSVRRLKIDRSFVARVNEDREQQKMVAAILSMAEQLGLDTLAEGVETSAEHSMLAQLGCGHVQGFGIARPMPFDETLGWIATYSARRAKLPKIGTKSR